MIDLTKRIPRNAPLWLRTRGPRGGLAKATYVRKAGFVRSAMLYVRTEDGVVHYVHYTDVAFR